ncbi:MAG: HAD hydrolase family protein, partial [Selenomonadaceae bacterium]|nr:HAD hydrolase family protein [Selenomonadaceae bacterium]
STAFKKLLEYLNVDPQNCIMFGDNDNDCEILSMVGCPITMNTAKSNIRAMGRYNIDTVESALIKILDGDGFDW